MKCNHCNVTHWKALGYNRHKYSNYYLIIGCALCVVCYHSFTQRPGQDVKRPPTSPPSLSSPTPTSIYNPNTQTLLRQQETEIYNTITTTTNTQTHSSYHCTHIHILSPNNTQYYTQPPIYTLISILLHIISNTINNHSVSHSISHTVSNI
jgi:hypothetical protein